MLKIFILGTSRTASKLYREILNKHQDVYILHEIMFDFRWKTDLHEIFQKHGVYKNRNNLDAALNEIYEKPYFRNFKTEYDNRDGLKNALQQLENFNWENVLTCLTELKARSLNKEVAGAKNPVHYSFAKKVLKNLNEVRVIYLLRDPRAIYASEIPMKFKDSQLSQFPRIKPAFLQRFLIFIYTNIEWIWAMITYKRVKNNVLFCKYEALVNDPKKIFNDVFEYCGLSFKEDYYTGLDVIGSSHQVNKNAGISKHGIDKWKNMLNGFEKLWFKILIGLFNY